MGLQQQPAVCQGMAGFVFQHEFPQSGRRAAPSDEAQESGTAKSQRQGIVQVVQAYGTGHVVEYGIQLEVALVEFTRALVQQCPQPLVLFRRALAGHIFLFGLIGVRGRGMQLLDAHGIPRLATHATDAQEEFHRQQVAAVILAQMQFCLDTAAVRRDGRAAVVLLDDVEMALPRQALGFEKQCHLGPGMCDFVAACAEPCHPGGQVGQEWRAITIDKIRAKDSFDAMQRTIFKIHVIANHIKLFQNKTQTDIELHIKFTTIFNVKQTDQPPLASIWQNLSLSLTSTINSRSGSGYPNKYP